MPELKGEIPVECNLHCREDRRVDGDALKTVGQNRDAECGGGISSIAFFGLGKNISALL